MLADARRALSNLPYSEVKENIAAHYFTWAEYYEAVGRLDSAMEYNLRGMDYASEYINRDICRDLARISLKQGKRGEAMRYCDLYFTYADSLKDDEAAEYDNLLSYMERMLGIERDNVALADDKARLVVWLSVVVFVVLVAAFVIIRYFLNVRRRAREQHERVKKYLRRRHEREMQGVKRNSERIRQLEGELAATALGQIYTFGPTFRAENSNTPRHLAEFWMIEPEVAFNDITDNMELAEEFIKYCVRWALENCMDDVKFLNDMFDKELIARLEGVLKDSFVRLSYTEGIKILEEAVANGRKFEFPVYWGVDLAAEHERFLVEEHFKRPVILTDYPKEIKAFYMKQNEDGKTVRAMDVLFPKIGEIIGGSEREADYDKLLSRIEELHIPMKDMWWYLDTRRFGTVPHSGFGLGFERLLLFVTGMSNIRDVIPFPRTPNNAEF